MHRILLYKSVGVQIFSTLVHSGYIAFVKWE